MDRTNILDLAGHADLILDGSDKFEVRYVVNDEDIRYLDSLGTPVKDGDELSIIPAVAGG